MPIPHDPSDWKEPIATLHSRQYILNSAAAIVTGDRESVYGSPEDSFQTIANLWKAYIKGRLDTYLPLEPFDIAAMLSLLKIARLAHSSGQHLDSWIDLAGYAACGGEASNLSPNEEKPHA